MPGESLYPPSPLNVPEDLTRPSPRYKTQLSLVLLSLCLFFCLYFGIMAFCVLFFFWAVASLVLVSVHQGFVLLAIVQIAACVPLFLLFAYMLKNLFRWSRKER